MFIGNSIGEAYKEWQPGTAVFISSQTGSGKTSFILNELLPYAMKQNKKILYLVNRKVLKEQMEKEILKLPLELAEWIDVELYQAIENKVLNLNKVSYEPEWQQGFKNALKITVPEEKQQQILNRQNLHYGNKYLADGFKFLGKYNNYEYVVCDEAHYFLMDSNYNTNTILSYKFIKTFFANKIRIFMSATIADFQRLVEADEEMDFTYRTFWYDYKYYSSNAVFYQKKHLSYFKDVSYDYIDVKIIHHLKEIVSLIVHGTAKWLIFVDNKEQGKMLKTKISDMCIEEEKSISVSFVTADYLLDEGAKYEVENITDYSKQSAKVLIATSVLDNGINFKDIELRNVVILADTKTEFVQMLGRKRQDGQMLNLYIYKHDKDHFVRRKRICDRRKRMAEETYFSFKDEFVSVFQNKSMYANSIEYDSIVSNHVKLMDKVMNGKVRFDDVKALYLSLEGTLYLNMLSLRNLDILCQFYNYIIQQFEEYGEEEFLREQLRWLRKSDEEIEVILNSSKESYYEQCRKKLINELDKFDGKEVSKDEFIEFKITVMDELKALVEHVGPSHISYKTYMKSSESNERPISDKFMDFLRENCGIPFSIKSKPGKYIVTKIIE